MQNRLVRAPTHANPSTIRRLLPADAPHYRDLMLDAYSGAAEAFTSSREEREALPLQWWASRLSGDPAPDAFAYGAYVDDRLVGCVALARTPAAKLRHKARLLGTYVQPAYRHRGLARGLVRRALDAAAQVPGLLVVQLTVTAGNATALALYTDLGFSQFGVEPFAVAVDKGFVAKVHMWLALPDLIALAGPGRDA